MPEKPYDHNRIEMKWHQRWKDDSTLYRPLEDSSRPKYYVLEMLPYPSGTLHIGHIRNYSIGDALARYKWMRGFNVLHPMGWDAFGLPAENAAIANQRDPYEWTKSNIENMKRQHNRMAFSYDWSREIATCEPEYYRWNQWFFLKMLERDLAYRKKALVNWCPECGTVLANEQVVDGCCWRHEGTPVEQRELEQWFLRITKYADELLDDMRDLEAGWPDRVLAMQRNWIGRSEGAEVDFRHAGTDQHIRIFTTRIDTIYGATCLILAPEHPLATHLLPGDQRIKQMIDKRAAAGPADVDKEGFDTGAFAVNPFSGEEIPIWIGNFVLMGYGTGAIMGAPGEDQRDYEFAGKYDMPIVPVIRPADDSEPPRDKAYTDYGVLFDSGEFSGMPSEQARLAIAAEAQRRGIGKPAVNYHLRDWGVSRQRYWGTPIPIVYCPKDDPEGKGIPVPDSQLPVELPDIDVKEVLTGMGDPPLAKVASWVNTECPICGGPARREAETMDTFVDSAWYWARYLDPHNSREPFSRAKADRWLPVDVYVGGPEHAVLHLLYFRFWTKVMQELGLCGIDEPAQKLVTQGIVKGRDGEKMSKSKGNVVSPREIIEEFGADTARLFILFAAPAEKDMDWSDEQVQGQHRFLGRVWRLVQASLPRIAGVKAGGAPDELRRRTHKTILKVTQQLERLQFNTAISSLMELSNAAMDWTGEPGSLRESLEVLVQLLSPLAPHVAEELWRELGHTDDEVELGVSPWPDADPALVVDDAYQMAVQVNGKLRGEVQVAASADDAEIRDMAARDPKVAGWLQGKTVKKVVVVPKRLVNFVVA